MNVFRPTHHQVLAGLFQHKAVVLNQSPTSPWRYVVGISNGAHMPTVKRVNKNGETYYDSPSRRRAVEEGLDPGLFDILILYPSGVFHYAMLEVKIPPDKPSSDQLKWLTMAKDACAKAEILNVYGWEQLRDWIDDYFARTDKTYAFEA